MSIQSPDSMHYPTFSIHQHLGISANIPLPRDWRNLVSLFDKQGRRKHVEEYTERLKEYSAKGDVGDIRLLWSDEMPGLLAHIGVGIHGGLDILNKEDWIVRYAPHNLGWTNSLIAACVAQEYISELLKSKE